MGSNRNLTPAVEFYRINFSFRLPALLDQTNLDRVACPVASLFLAVSAPQAYEDECSMSRPAAAQRSSKYRLPLHEALLCLYRRSNEGACATFEQVKAHGIGVAVAYPPDTDTPGFETENVGKPEVTRLIGEDAGGLFSPTQASPPS